ncbi:MAG: hypothetical protein Q9166_005317 [cf. Caloplaca sp. 2 TL-2023]
MRRERPTLTSVPAVVRYKERALKYVKLLEQHVAEDVAARRPTDVRSLFSWFGFDVMGDFAFGKSFNMLENREWHFIIMGLREALSLLGPLSPVPWLVQFGFSLAGFLPFVRDWFAMTRWCRTQIENRAKSIELNPTREPDVSYQLLEEARRSGFTDTDWNWLSGDAVVSVVAGSDPARTEKLHAEVAAIDCADDNLLQKLPYLNGVVNEVLRLHPALPTGGYRKTPREGAIICGTFVPGETTIISPRYSIFRRELRRTATASTIAYASGQAKTALRNQILSSPSDGAKARKCLGLAELRVVTATLVKQYTIDFDHDKRSARFLDEIQDCFVARTGPLELRFEARSAAEVN